MSYTTCHSSHKNLDKILKLNSFIENYKLYCFHDKTE